MAKKVQRPPRRQKKSIAKPIIVIVVAVVVAGGAALYFSRQQPAVPNNSQPSRLASTAAGPATPPSAALPMGPRLSMPIGGGHTRGSTGAPITLVEFGDYQCPTCAAFAPVVNDVLRRHANEIRLEFHYFPLNSIHRNAMAAAIAAEAAADQNRFWEMHDLLFERQPAWANLPDAKAEFLSYARQLGLDVDKFSKSMSSPEVEQRVREDEARAHRANLNEVPTFFVNGNRILLPSPHAEVFWRVIQQSAETK